jgi:hypothetical protein
MTCTLDGPGYHWEVTTKNPFSPFPDCSLEGLPDSDLLDKGFRLLQSFVTHQNSRSRHRASSQILNVMSDWFIMTLVVEMFGA